jgi:NitT/TauT family transport system substrate-binding protein
MLKKFVLFLFSFLGLFASDKIDKLVIAGPFATVSHPIMRMIETNALSDVAKNVEFKLWKNPDELRALVLSKDVQFCAVPTNVGANLYNKGINIHLLNVSVWGILQMLTRDKNLQTLQDFKGKEIAMPFRADMPDIVFQQLAKAQGLNPQKDFNLRYVNSPIDAMQMLIMRRVDNALLAEPAVSMALRKTKSFPLKLIAPDLYRSVDLQKEWGKIYHVESKIPQAGIAFLGDIMSNEHLIKRFNEEYAKALHWYKSHPKNAAKLTVKTLNMLQEKGLEDSIPHVNFSYVSAQQAKKDLIFFFNILKKSDPKIIGGRLPDDGFYYTK